MNYLAHAHLANISDTSIVGNLLGDFTKGFDIKKLNRDWRIGVKLHRSIDTYTDHHEIVTMMKQEFGQLRRYAGIALDIIFDHIIAKHFDVISKKSFTSFINETHQALTMPKQDLTKLPKRFQLFTQGIVKGQWLLNSKKLEHIERALHHTGQRISSRPPLTKTLVWYVNNHQCVDEQFLVFYRALQCHSIEHAQQLTQREQQGTGIIKI